MWKQVRATGLRRWARAVRLRVPALIVGVAFMMTLSSCEKRKTVDVVNPCSEPVTVRLWETPRPHQVNESPRRIEVPPLRRIRVSHALADVGKDGSSAEIVAGPGEGKVLFIPHVGELVVVIPATLCQGAS